MSDATVTVGGLTLHDQATAVAEPDGTVWVLTKLTGWHGGVTPRVTVVDPGGLVDGVHDGLPTFGGRTVTVEGAVACPAELQRDVMDRVARVLAGDIRLGTLEVTEDNRSRQATVRLGGVTLVAKSGRRGVTFSLNLFSANPSRSGSDVRTVTTTRATPGGLLTIPLTVPIVFGAAGTSGFVTAVNDGDSAAWPVIRFTGPLTEPALRVVGGPALEAAITLAAGEQLVVDTADHTVLLGTSSRRGVLSITSQWFGLPPGANQLFFEAAAGAGTVTVEWRDSWA